MNPICTPVVEGSSSRSNGTGCSGHVDTLLVTAFAGVLLCLSFLYLATRGVSSDTQYDFRVNDHILFHSPPASAR
jgi:hypothetical protein